MKCDNCGEIMKPIYSLGSKKPIMYMCSCGKSYFCEYQREGKDGKIEDNEGIY